MLWFHKKFDSKQAKKDLIEDIESLQRELTAHGLGKITRLLDQVITVLDDKYLQFGSEKSEAMHRFIENMKQHSTKQYDLYLQKKCEHMILVLKDSRSGTQFDTKDIDNDDRLFEIMGESAVLAEQVDDINTKMNDALGNNKSLWLLLNSQKRTLQQRITVLSKNYQTLLEHQSAVAIASEVRKAKEEAESILRSSGSFDLEEFEANAELTTMAAEEVHENTDRIQEVFSKSFGAESVDGSDYERALEEKLLQESKKSEADQESSSVNN